MQILKELRTATGYSAFLATTYNLDLPWFEALLLRQLNNNGVKLFAIFADEEQLSQALGTQADNLYRAGRTYMLQGVRSGQSFHPKIILLAGENRARLYVGSGNLSKGGLQYNLEIFESWDYESKDGQIPAEFFFIRNYFYNLVDKQIAFCPPLLRSALDKIFCKPVFNQPVDATAVSRLLASPSALFDSVPRKDDCNKLRIVSPFFDDRGYFTTELAKRFNAPSFQVITDIRNTNLTPEGVRCIESSGGEILTLDANKHSRTLHAKVYFAKGDDWSWGAAGSANASIAAWHAHNGEVISVKEGPDTAIIDNLIDGLATRPLSENDRKIIENKAQQRALEDKEKGEECKTPPGILFSEWMSLTRIKLTVRPGSWDIAQVEFFDENPIKASPLSIEQTGNGLLQVLVAYPQAPDHTRVNLLRLIGEEAAGPWAVIHDPDELRAQASRSRPEREKLEELLGKDYFDPDAAQKMMELYAHIMQERIKQKQLAKEAAKEKSKSKKSQDSSETKPDWRDVDLNNFTNNEPGSNPWDGEKPGGGTILSTRLMNQLLFGDIDGKVQVVDNEGESELDEGNFGEDGNPMKSGNRWSKKYGAVDTNKQILFLEAAKNARKKYVHDLASDEDSLTKGPYRLLEDLQILAAPMHYMFQGGGMGPGSFRTEMVKTLRAFMGNASSPFIESVKNLDMDSSREFWGNTPSFHLVHLLVYNACLADADVGFSHSGIVHGFTKALPVMWLRHVIREVPTDLLQNLIDKTLAIIPMLRSGTFWIADKLATWEKQLPFPDFVTTMIHQSQLLETLDREFVRLFGRMAGKGLKQAEDEGVLVLGRRDKGSLGIGWIEDGRILVHDSAFQKPDEEYYFERMPRLEAGQAVPLQLIEACHETLPTEVIQGIELVKLINP